MAVLSTIVRDWIDEECQAHPELMEKVLRTEKWGPLHGWVDDHLNPTCGCLIGTYEICKAGQGVPLRTPAWTIDSRKYDVGIAVAACGDGVRSRARHRGQYLTRAQADALVIEAIKTRIGEQLGIPRCAGTLTKGG